MELAYDQPQGNFISHYASDHIVVNDTAYFSAFIISADRIINENVPNTAADLSIANLQILHEFNPEIILLGTGEKLIFPADELLAHFGQCKIGVECMTTTAACRTYNLLNSELRRVVALLLI